MSEQIKRNLDGCFFRVERDGKWDNICFSDLTAKERDAVLQGKSEEWLKSLCCHLAEKLWDIGEWYNIEGYWGETDE